MHLIGCLFVLILIILIFIPALIMSAVTGFVDWLKEIFTGKKPSSRNSGFGGANTGGFGSGRNTRGNGGNNAQSAASPSGRQKIIPADEGEYVDFEEVSDY